MSESNGRSGAPGPSLAHLSDLYTPVLRLLWPIVLESTRGPASPELMMGICFEESRFDPAPQRSDGGQGLFGMTPPVAQSVAVRLAGVSPSMALLGIDLYDMETAIVLASLHFNDLLRRFEIPQALLAFHLGVDIVEREGNTLLTIPRHAQYVRNVLGAMTWLAHAQPWRKPSTRPPASDVHDGDRRARVVPPPGGAPCND